MFVSDSANDVIMLGFFPLSVGTANILDVTGMLLVPPAYLTTAEGGDGFTEVTERILEACPLTLLAPYD